jgi:hypothetical protein
VKYVPYVVESFVHLLFLVALDVQTLPLQFFR